MSQLALGLEWPAHLCCQRGHLACACDLSVGRYWYAASAPDDGPDVEAIRTRLGIEPDPAWHRIGNVAYRIGTASGDSGHTHSEDRPLIEPACVQTGRVGVSVPLEHKKAASFSELTPPQTRLSACIPTNRSARGRP